MMTRTSRAFKTGAAALLAAGASSLGAVVALEGGSGAQRRTGIGQGAPSHGWQAPARQPVLENAQVHTLQVQGAVYMLVGAGGNMTVQVGEDGVLLVDTSLAEMSDKILAEIRKLSSKPIYWIINTHGHPDHVSGNENLSKPSADFLAPAGVQIVAHENVLRRMSAPAGVQPPFPEPLWPTDTFAGRQKEIFFNNEPVIVMHQPAAHTDGDSLVFFRRSDVVSTGDVFQTTSYPFIDVDQGGSLAGIIDAVNNILDITVPRDKQEGGTYVIPGHGRLCDEHDVLEYRDMLTIIRDRVEDAVRRGLTLDQVKAMRPTLDYDARWGRPTAGWTAEKFLEVVYREIKGRAGSKREGGR
jgi:glyoxylase-like metal-dependent hydrolase (beta-lactamase superfamily II)